LLELAHLSAASGDAVLDPKKHPAEPPEVLHLVDDLVQMYAISQVHVHRRDRLVTLRCSSGCCGAAVAMFLSRPGGDLDLGELMGQTDFRHVTGASQQAGVELCCALLAVKRGVVRDESK
jgi:hypothetical protein